MNMNNTIGEEKTSSGGGSGGDSVVLVLEGLRQ